jgi:hypothetical protein
MSQKRAKNYGSRQKRLKNGAPEERPSYRTHFFMTLILLVKSNV